MLFWWGISLTLPILIIVLKRVFVGTSCAGLRRIFFFTTVTLLVLESARTLVLLYCSQLWLHRNIPTLYFFQTKMQEQGLSGYSSALLTSRAPHRLGKCRLSWVWLFWAAIGSWRVQRMFRARQPPTRLSWFRLGTDTPDSSVLTWPSPCIFYIFFFLTPVLVKSSSYTPRACFSEEYLGFHSISSFCKEFLLHSWCLILVRSFSYTRHASSSEEFLLHS